MTTTHHITHSSVTLLENGQYMETRRGSLRYFAIPTPAIWNSIQEWHACIPYIPFDLASRPVPSHYTIDQVWVAQWHETSTLVFTQDHTNCWRLVPQDPILLVMDSISGYLIPLYMNLETGTLSANGEQFTYFAEISLQIQQIWRYESGTYYRVL
jgi:hypothetical protein